MMKRKAALLLGMLFLSNLFLPSCSTAVSAVEAARIYLLAKENDAEKLKKAISREPRSAELALEMAVRKDDLTSVEALLKNGASANSLGEKGSAIILVASVTAGPGVCEALIKAGADLDVREKIANNNALINAAIKNRPEIVKVLLQAKSPVDSKNRVGATALMSAADAGGLECVNLLLAAGADPNLRANNGFTTLMDASSSGHLEIVKTLVKKGADINAHLDNGICPVSLAIVDEQPEVLKYLLTQDASLNFTLRDPELIKATGIKVVDPHALADAIGNTTVIGVLRTVESAK
jgi:hypothetical protein